MKRKRRNKQINGFKSRNYGTTATMTQPFTQPLPLIGSPARWTAHIQQSLSAVD